MRTRRGATFVVTIAVLAGLVAILAGAAATQAVAAQAAIRRINQRRADLAARSGLERARQIFETQASGITKQSDDWYTLGSVGADEFQVGDATFRMQIVDASSRVNVSTASQTLLGKLPLSADQVASILDYRSAGQTPSQGGAKDDYYHGLANGYNTRLSGFSCLSELMQVKGITGDTLYNPQNVNGTDQITTNPSNPALTSTAYDNSTIYDICETSSLARSVNPNGTALININTATQQQLTRAGLNAGVAQAIITRRNQGTFTSLGQVLALGQVNNAAAKTILDNFAVDSQTTHAGRINLNTTSNNILAALPNMTSTIAQNIASRQSSGIQSVADLLNLGMNKNQLGALAETLSVNSCTFLVRVIGKAGGETVALEALLRTDGTTPTYSRIEVPPFNNMDQRWNWNDVNNTITLGDAR